MSLFQRLVVAVVWICMVGACAPVRPFLLAKLPAVPIPDLTLDDPFSTDPFSTDQTSTDPFSTDQTSIDQPSIPALPSASLSGTRFLKSIAQSDESRRERLVLEEIRRGNVPASHRTLVRLDFSGESRSGQKHDVTLWVMPDYVSIGDDADHVRVPMTPLTAQLVADHLGYLLPTSRMVDLIHQKAAVRLQPYPLPPSERMVLMEEFARHSRLIDRQLGEQGLVGRGAMLVAGHKKDIVLSNRLLSAPHRVAIYGWHDPRAQPIQPLSTIHGDWYADYSHGVRLVSTTMLLDGTPMRVEEALHDVDLAQLLSDEGPIVRTRYPTELGFGKPRGLPGLAPAPAPTPTPTQHLGPEQALAFYQGIPSTAR